MATLKSSLGSKKKKKLYTLISLIKHTSFCFPFLSVIFMNNLLCPFYIHLIPHNLYLSLLPSPWAKQLVRGGKKTPIKFSLTPNFMCHFFFPLRFLGLVMCLKLPNKLRACLKFHLRPFS